MSTEHGLEQEFNSLDNQREAAEAYIKSQAHEGWRLLPARYDDGGFSGGSMERPGLQQLLADIRARLIDVVVVYKVDRLTRSLGDFAKLVELFDEHGVSFVSVTQSFNTTSSMGRLTLNVLLSFAQFEREVTGERIRDKIAASKKKGMWMGGVVPLGYRVAGSRAAHRRGACGPDPLDLRALPRARQRRSRLKRRSRPGGRHRARAPDRAGRASGGGPFSRGHLLQDPDEPDLHRPAHPQGAGARGPAPADRRSRRSGMPSSSAWRARRKPQATRQPSEARSAARSCSMIAGTA